MLVRELMTAEPVSVDPETTVKAALRLLDEHNITMLPVTRGHRVQGVVSEADLIRDLIDRDPRLHEIPEAPWPADRPRCVSDVMTAHAVTVHPDTDLAVAVDLATTTAVKSLPVVDDRGRLVGVLSRRDVVRMLARSDDLLEADVDALLVSAGVRDWLVDVHDGIAEITGPGTEAERGLARAIAQAVPGVVEVRVD